MKQYIEDPKQNPIYCSESFVLECISSLPQPSSWCTSYTAQYSRLKQIHFYLHANW